MKLNAKTRYGIRTMLEIATHDQSEGIFQKNIAENQNISFKYLDHIIQNLKSAMLIANAKGKKSGYVLLRRPEEISVYDIYQAFEPEICIVDCLSNRSGCARNGKCSAQGLYGELNTMIRNYLKNITLKNLIDKQETLDL